MATPSLMAWALAITSVQMALTHAADVGGSQFAAAWVAERLIAQETLAQLPAGIPRVE